MPHVEEANFHLMRFSILGSSSSGNAALLQWGSSSFLIDAGFSAKRLHALLKQQALTPHSLDAVFLTHEHEDHARGLKAFNHPHACPIFANKRTLEAVIQRQGQLENLTWKVFETALPFEFQNVGIQAFRLPHDAHEPVGFVFELKKETKVLKRVGWFTDLGYVPPALLDVMGQCHLLILEANYGEDLLRTCKRPFSLKQRVGGRHGHLSNEAALACMKHLEHAAWQHLCLVHLSTHCNRLELVETLFRPLATPPRRIDVVPPQGLTFPLTPH